MTTNKGDSFTKARSLLARVQKQGQQDIFQDGKQVAETLSCAITLLQNFQSSVNSNGNVNSNEEAGQLQDPSSQDWKVIKALLELIVRLGISPYLSPGVGIARDKQNGSFFAAASAISDHLSSISISGSLFSLPADHSETGRGILLICAEVLGSQLWMKPTATDFVNALSEEEDVFSLLEPPLPPVADIVVKYFLWDLVAAYLQLAFSPSQDNHVSSMTTYASFASRRLAQMCDKLPVENMIEASFVLLNWASPPPPQWLKLEVGKQLSKLIMRKGGLSVVLRELVGHVTKGNVESYDKIASHLAKVPRSIATQDEYFKAISAQLIPLLLLKVRDLEGGETSRTAVTNMYHTAKSLACRLFSVAPVVAKKYIVKPIVQPLVAWCSVQINLNQQNSELNMEVTENELMDSLMQLQLLLTAGCRGSSSARESILNETKELMPWLFKLHFQLESSFISNNIPSKKQGNGIANHMKKQISGGKGITKGFLNQGLGIEVETNEHQSALSRLRSSLSDLVMAYVSQPVDITLPNVLPLLMEPNHTASLVQWPVEHGEVWEAICCSLSRHESIAMYLSRLLCSVENWSLVVALMGDLLHKILDLQTLLADINAARTSVAEELLRHMKNFEVLNNEAGSTALEHDTYRASCLVKALLENENVFSDEDMLELVLHMVNNVLKGFRSSKCSETQMSVDVQVAVKDIRIALEKVYGNAGLREKLRQMSFTLAEEINHFCNTS